MKDLIIHQLVFHRVYVYYANTLSFPGSMVGIHLHSLCLPVEINSWPYWLKNIHGELKILCLALFTYSKSLPLTVRNLNQGMFYGTAIVETVNIINSQSA